MKWFGCAGVLVYRGSLDELHLRYGLPVSLNRWLPTFPRGNAVTGCCQPNDVIGWMRLALMVVGFHGRTQVLTLDSSRLTARLPSSRSIHRLANWLADAG